MQPEAMTDEMLQTHDDVVATYPWWHLIWLPEPLPYLSSAVVVEEQWSKENPSLGV